MGADRPPLVLGAQSLAGVVDQPEPVPLGNRAQLVELAGIAEHVDRDDALRPFRDRGLDRGGIEVQRLRVDVGEHRPPALEDEAVRSGHEGDRRRDHLVPLLHAGDVAEHVQACGTARHRGGVRSADALGEQLLEPLDRRPQREPAGAENV